MEYTFYSDYLRSLQPYHSLFYQLNSQNRYVKSVPAELLQLITHPLSLLVWYFDDGTLRNDCDSCRLSTQRFSEQDQEILHTLLRDRFALRSELTKWRRERGGYYYGLSLRALQLAKRRSLKNFVHCCWICVFKSVM